MGGTGIPDAHPGAGERGRTGTEVSVCLTAVVDSDHPDNPGGIEVEEHPPLPDAEPELADTALEPLHIAMPGRRISF